MVKIIAIGRCCRVSTDMINMNLKCETSLFEWVWSNTLTEINTIIQKLINNQPIYKSYALICIKLHLRCGI